MNHSVYNKIKTLHYNEENLSAAELHIPNPGTWLGIQVGFTQVCFHSTDTMF